MTAGFPLRGQRLNSALAHCMVVRCLGPRHFMSCLGVHFALTEKEVAHLRSLTDEQARLKHLQEVIEPAYLEQQSDFAAESDKSWDAMHRTLADGQLAIHPHLKLAADGEWHP
jgi:hypothetical protein